MLTKTQKEYLENLPQKLLQKKVKVFKYDPHGKIIAQKIIQKIQRILPVKVHYMGSSALEISGMKDIDLFIFTNQIKDKYIKKINQILGFKPIKDKWRWKEDGFKITLKITNPNDQKRKEQILFFKILKRNPFLRKKYEEYKSFTNDKTYKEYLYTKMDFFSRVVKIFNKDNQRNFMYLKRIGVAINNSHIRLGPNLHTSQSFCTEKLFKHKKQTLYVTQKITHKYKKNNIHVVIGIVKNGDVLAHKIAQSLSIITNKKVLPISIKKDAKDNFFIKNKELQKLLHNKNILLVDDTIKTGKTFIKVIKSLEKYKAKIVGIAVICARNNIPVSISDTIKFYSFLTQDDYLFSYKKNKCPYCKIKTPLNKNFGFPK